MWHVSNWENPSNDKCHANHDSEVWKGVSVQMSKQLSYFNPDPFPKLIPDPILVIAQGAAALGSYATTSTQIIFPSDPPTQW